MPSSPSPSFEYIGEDEIEMDQVIMSERGWDDLCPNKVKNQFLKQVISQWLYYNWKISVAKEGMPNAKLTLTSRLDSHRVNFLKNLNLTLI